ncbi:MAG: LGFP repeat-containing protein [Microbacterium gubbeenense]
MRRTNHGYRYAQKGRALFGVAMAAALIGSLLPTAAYADEQPAPEPTPTVAPSPEVAATEQPPESEPTSTPTPEPTDAPEPAPEQAPTAEPTQEPTPTPAPTPTPTMTTDPGEVDLTGILLPDNGDYAGDTTEDEADPGAYSETQTGLLTADTLNGFKAGNIISDAKMYTSGTMSANQIQGFFNQKVKRCDSNYTCLKDFSMKTRTKAPNSYCTNTYQGSSRDTAAQIISKVSKACNVSERVLIVMLQKEQGLVTHTWPSQFRYDIAMGYACPDHAACDSTYFGFQNQMYMAAYQLQRYTKDRYFSWYPVGKTSQVRWHPNASCGTGPVRIENKATAALYYYTPYQPNRAAMRAGYGVGDSCSAYGNRNFYNYYTDWFGGTRGGSPGGGTTGYSVTGATAVKWKSLGGASGMLGKPIDKKNCTSGVGCYQVFKGGSIYWTHKHGAVYVRGAVRDAWAKVGSRNGVLRYPTSDPQCGLTRGACLQHFQDGTMYAMSGHGAHYVRGAIRNKWAQTGDRHGTLGYPISNPRCGLVDGACLQVFEDGRIYASNAGTHYVRGAIFDGWGRAGGREGRLGYPSSDPRCGGNACTQSFEGGTVRHQSGSTPRVLYR